MSDCANVEMRDRLPDFLHDTLSDAERTLVELHLAECADCTAELAVLESARMVLASRRVAPIDVAAITRALPRPPVTAEVMRRPRRQQSPLPLRLAAALTVIALGGISVAVARSFFDGTAAVVADSRSAVDTPALAVADPERAWSVGMGLSELGDADLESLLGELDAFEAAPLAEPETTPGGRVVGSTVSGS